MNNQQVTVVNVSNAGRADGRSKLVCFVLWLLLGGLGVHCFYAGRTVSGLLFLASFALVVVTVGLWAFVHVPLMLISGLHLLIAKWEDYSR